MDVFKELNLLMRYCLSTSVWFSRLPRTAPFLSWGEEIKYGVCCFRGRVVSTGQPPRQEPAQQQPVRPERSQQQLVRPELHRLHVRLLPLRVPPLRGGEAEDHRVRPHARIRRARYAQHISGFSELTARFQALIFSEITIGTFNNGYKTIRSFLTFLLMISSLSLQRSRNMK